MSLANIYKIKSLALTLLIALGLHAHGTSVTANRSETLVVAGGCFWCVESDFESVPGVHEVVSGYTGGKTKNPTYKQVTKGGTGHYEAVEIRYNSGRVSTERLLYLFFRSVDPTDAGGQFCDRGASYRTAIFYADAEEKALAEKAKAEAQAALGRKIVTPILPRGQFYKAEAYHQDYYKSGKIVVTRFGPKKKSEAYKLYRKGCGRDKRLRQLWGRAAFPG